MKNIIYCILFFLLGTPLTAQFFEDVDPSHIDSPALNKIKSIVYNKNVNSLKEYCNEHVINDIDKVFLILDSMSQVLNISLKDSKDYYSYKQEGDSIMMFSFFAKDYGSHPVKVKFYYHNILNPLIYLIKIEYARETFYSPKIINTIKYKTRRLNPYVHDKASNNTLIKIIELYHEADKLGTNIIARERMIITRLMGDVLTNYLYLDDIESALKIANSLQKFEKVHYSANSALLFLFLLEDQNERAEPYIKDILESKPSTRRNKLSPIRKNVEGLKRNNIDVTKVTLWLEQIDNIEK